MKPSEARFALINDAPEALDMVGFAVKRIGGTLVQGACNVVEAEDIVDGLGASGVNVVLMDCNLGPAGEEGIGLTMRIQAEHPEVHVLSVSADNKLGRVTGIPILKRLGYNAEELAAAIAPLLAY